MYALLFQRTTGATRKQRQGIQRKALIKTGRVLPRPVERTLEEGKHLKGEFSAHFDTTIYSPRLQRKNSIRFAFLRLYGAITSLTNGWPW
jgi:hypothetical protein